VISSPLLRTTLPASGGRYFKPRVGVRYRLQARWHKRTEGALCAEHHFMIGRLRSRHFCSGDADHIRWGARLNPCFSHFKVTWIPISSSLPQATPPKFRPAAFTGRGRKLGDGRAGDAPFGRTTGFRPFRCAKADTFSKKRRVSGNCVARPLTELEQGFCHPMEGVAIRTAALGLGLHLKLDERIPGEPACIET
jgi:hypothetical protein